MVYCTFNFDQNKQVRAPLILMTDEHEEQVNC